MKNTFVSLLCAALALTGSALTAHAQTPAAPTGGLLAPGATLRDVRVVLHTDKGDIEMTVFASKAPITSASFLNLAQKKFYDGLTFHRVIGGFMIQGGDPTGTGAGSAGYKFEDEPNKDLRFDKAGVLAMANSGRNTNGSQFFITHNAVPHLNDDAGTGHYTIFGQVTKGQEVVNAIRKDDHIKSIDVLDSTVPLFAAESEYLTRWNSVIPAGKGQ